MPSPFGSRAWTMSFSHLPVVMRRATVTVPPSRNRPSGLPTPPALLPEKTVPRDLDFGLRPCARHGGAPDPVRRDARYVRNHPAEPDRLPARATAARLLHDPAGDLRADVPVRVRWRDPA